MGLSTTYKLKTRRQTWEDNNLKSDFDYYIGVFLVSRSFEDSGDYPMTPIKIKVAYRKGNAILDAELYVMLLDLSGGIDFAPRGVDEPNIFPIKLPADIERYPHLIYSDDPNIFDYFSISFFLSSIAPEGDYYSIIIHSPNYIEGTMIADVYSYTLYQ
jgi:hypothetical protein